MDAGSSLSIQGADLEPALVTEEDDYEEICIEVNDQEGPLPDNVCAKQPKIETASRDTKSMSY